MHSNAKSLIKGFIGIRENETIDDGLRRKKTNFEKIFFTKKYTKGDLKDALIKVGIEAGDNVMLHCSFRDLYNFLGTPSDIIEILLSIIGEEGTLLMPCYGMDLYCFDIKNSKSAAGAVSEVFRTYDNVIRSECTNFSICALGKNAKVFTDEHFKSVYGFDEYSPYYKFAQHENSKIVMLGLGRKPVKNSIFHFPGYLQREEISAFSNLLCENYSATLIRENGEIVKKSMITRDNSIKNSNKGMKAVFDMIPPIHKQYIKVPNLDIVVYNARSALNTAMEAAQKGIFIYKGLH